MINVKPGQELAINWRGAWDLVGKKIDQLKLNPLTNGTSAEISAHVTFVDKNGVSVYIRRGSFLGPDIEGFVGQDVSFGSYFVILHAINPSYAGTKHYHRKFPDDFL
jgi:hypothetical protein